VLVLDAVLRVDVLKRGWTRLPLWSEGSLVRFDGDGGMLHRGAKGLELLAQGPRAYELRARLVYAAPDHPGENRVQLALPDAPLNLLDLTAADGLQDLEVTTGVAYRVLPSRVFATLHGGRATIRYRVPYRAVDTEGGEVVALEPRVLLTSYQFLNLGDGVVSGLLVNDYQVRVAKVSEFEIGLAEGIEVFDVEAEGLEGWQVLQRDGSRVLRARLAAPTEGGVRVIVTFDGGYDPEVGDVGVPRFEPLDVERESGFVAVAAEGAEVELNLSGNLLPADLLEIPGDVRAFGGSVAAVLKFAGEPDAATAVVTEHEDAEVLTAIVERLNASTVVVGSGTEATWLDLTVKNNRKQFLKLRLDKEIEVWSLLVDGEPARPKRSEGQVFVPLPRGDGERTAVISLVLLRRGEPMPGLGTTRPSLPGLDVPVSEAMWTLYARRAGFRGYVDPLSSARSTISADRWGVSRAQRHRPALRLRWARLRPAASDAGCPDGVRRCLHVEGDRGGAERATAEDHPAAQGQTGRRSPRFPSSAHRSSRWGGVVAADHGCEDPHR
jgi:hypothetical protein